MGERYVYFKCPQCMLRLVVRLTYNNRSIYTVINF